MPHSAVTIQILIRKYAYKQQYFIQRQRQMQLLGVLVFLVQKFSFRTFFIHVVLVSNRCELFLFQKSCNQPTSVVLNIYDRVRQHTEPQTIQKNGQIAINLKLFLSLFFINSALKSSLCGSAKSRHIVICFFHADVSTTNPIWRQMKRFYIILLFQEEF